jgi:hypothetical protein
VVEQQVKMIDKREVRDIVVGGERASFLAGSHAQSACPSNNNSMREKAL